MSQDEYGAVAPLQGAEKLKREPPGGLLIRLRKLRRIRRPPAYFRLPLRGFIEAVTPAPGGLRHKPHVAHPSLNRSESTRQIPVVQCPEK